MYGFESRNAAHPEQKTYVQRASLMMPSPKTGEKAIPAALRSG